LVSGTAGMSLATVIRMEFAYPGVGVLAGDSIQYLSIATAHGVIMVFFMIMPAIFGAFGNFLLPTQLGVHDVAFPRLNSAAFWFLPGGLIMLCQLVCVDRRYQRMNCFNIRELQGILKRKFFTDLVNTTDSHTATESTLINMRHKNNMSNILIYDQALLYNFDITTTSKFKNFFYTPGKIYSYSSFFDKNYYINLSYFFTLKLTNISLFFKNISFFFKDLINFIPTVSIISLIYFPISFNYLFATLSNNLSFQLPLVINFFDKFFFFKYNVENNNNKVYNSSTVNYQKFSNSSTSNFAENSSTWRFNRYSFPLISYDYKSGNYLSIWDQLYPSLSLSFIEVARGIRKAP
jgi:hypothetical protein